MAVKNTLSWDPSRLKGLFQPKMSAEKTDYTLINKLTVSIASHRNQLAKCDNLDEMERICKSIYEMENEIIQERRKELKSLYTKKEEVLQKIAALESTLDGINREIMARTNRYRDAIVSRISQLESEVNKGEVEPPTLG